MQQDQYYIRQILAEGSEEALYKLVKKYQKQVFNLCFRIIRNREEAEEAAQDVFLKAFAQLKNLEDPTRFAAWLMRITYHRAIDYARLEKKRPVELDEEGWARIEEQYEPGPQEQLVRMERIELIERILAVLPPTENALMSFFYMEEMSVKEVAELTGLSESNVKIKLMRTRKVVKKLLERSLGNEIEDIR